jgi:Uma2 family endonuclease
MSDAIKIFPYYTYSDYVKWEGRWEIIDGMPYAMSPAPAPKHQYVVSQIQYEFNLAIKQNKCKKCKVYDFIDIKINEDTVIQPDTLIVCNEITKPFLDFSPTLVVEVLSPSTALKDLNTSSINPLE